ncbi:hypothetical protein KAJ27_25200 [bacterium]|nr:hypothetical protein [bacterium]
MFKLITVSLAIFLIVSTVYGVLGPNHYKEKIENSKVKVIATVVSVKVISANDVYIEKNVIFKVRKSYGKDKAFSNISGYCYSPGGKPSEGGMLYFYPEKGDEVYVTIMNENGKVTSMTPVTPELEKALTDYPESIVPGLGKVRIDRSILNKKKLDNLNEENKKALDIDNVPFFDENDLKDDNDSDFLKAVSDLQKIIPETGNLSKSLKKELSDILKKASLSLIKIKKNK